MDMTLIEFKLLTSICWDDKHHFFTIDVTKDNYTGRYRLGLETLFILHTNPF